MRNLGIVAVATVLASCASSAADITPAYVSPVTYQSFTCRQLGLEAQSISARAAALSGTQDSQRTKDTVATTAAVIIFWPAAFLVGGDKQTAADERPDGGCRAGVDSKELRDQVRGTAAARDVI
jgi:hypothetical protein